MEEFFDMIGVLFMNAMALSMILLVTIAGLVIIVLVLDMLFGKAKPASKTGNKSATKSAGVVCDWNAADETQRRSMQENARAHEESMRLHDVAVREAWDAHKAACDQHQAAVDMHNDFSFCGCDPWL